MGNLQSEFGHAMPSGSTVIRYVPDGRTDGRTYKSTLNALFVAGGGIQTELKGKLRIEIIDVRMHDNLSISNNWHFVDRLGTYVVLFIAR